MLTKQARGVSMEKNKILTGSWSNSAERELYDSDPWTWSG